MKKTISPKSQTNQCCVKSSHLCSDRIRIALVKAWSLRYTCTSNNISNLSLPITDHLHTSGSELITVPTPPLSIYPLTKPHNVGLAIWPRVGTANCRHNSNLISKPNNWSLLDMFGFVEGLALQSKIPISDITPEEAAYWYTRVQGSVGETSRGATENHH